MLKDILFAILFLSWMVFVTFSSLFSFEGVSVSSLPFKIPHLDKVVHFIFYLGMVITCFMALNRSALAKRNAKGMLIGIALFSIVYGIIIEVLQFSLTTSRQGDVLDALANTMGAITGLLLIKALFYREWRLK